MKEEEEEDPWAKPLDKELPAGPIEPPVPAGPTDQPEPSLEGLSLAADKPAGP